MKTRTLIIIAILGIVTGLISVYVYNAKPKPQPPLTINYNPYKAGVYASGIVESFQASGSNVNIYPEVAGKITKIIATDGQMVKRGDPLLVLDDSVQRAIVYKDYAQAKAAWTLLAELKAQPRKENLDIAIAGVDYAKSVVKNTQDQLKKVQTSYNLNHQSVSKNDLDNAINALKIAKSSLDVAQKQYILVKAGAWIYNIKNQENQYIAAVQLYNSDKALLDKFVVRAQTDGIILRMVGAVGGYVTPNGIYDAYTQNMIPIATMGSDQTYLAVRCYVDEILIPRLPTPEMLEAKMMIRGQSNYTINLEFFKIQPYTIPNIQLSNEVAQRVDVRVLPIVFKFKKPKDINIFPGQLVDVYLKGKVITKESAMSDKKI
jgi:HlyD family secretion protein